MGKMRAHFFEQNLFVLQQHLFRNFEPVCPLEAGSKAALFQEPNDPLGRVEVKPSDAVAVILGKGMVVIVISFAEGEDGEEVIVNGGMLGRVVLVAPVVGKGIDEPGEVVKEKEAA